MLAEVEAKTVGKTLGNVQVEVVAKRIAETLTCVWRTSNQVKTAG